MKGFAIGEKRIGADLPVLVVAEIGINHNGDPSLAKKMVRAAKESGADAVKLQVFKAETFVSKKIGKADHQRQTLKKKETLYEMWKRLELSRKSVGQIKKEAERKGLAFIASVFDEQSLQDLESFGVAAYKVASGEVTNIPLIEKIARKGRPVIVSVGMATQGEIDEALSAIYAAKNNRVALLQCVANYPAPIEACHMRKIRSLAEKYGVPSGFSDHTTSLWVPAIAVAMGACIIEKHFTLDKRMPGTDQSLSADPQDLKTIIEGVRQAERALGNGMIQPAATEKQGRVLFRRGIFAVKDIPSGAVITREMLGIMRPATGLAPKYIDAIVGKRAKSDIKNQEPLRWELLCRR